MIKLSIGKGTKRQRGFLAMVTEIVKVREAWHAAVHAVTELDTT